MADARTDRRTDGRRATLNAAPPIGRALSIIADLFYTIFTKFSLFRYLKFLKLHCTKDED